MKKNEERTKKFNGEGTVYFSKSRNRYVAQLTDPNTGKRKTVGSDKDERKCNAILRKALSDIENGKYTEKSTITVKELGQEIIDLKHNINITCDSTYLRSKETLKKIANSNLGESRINKVTRSQIQDFFGTIKSYSNSCINKIYNLLNQIFTEAILRNIIVKNPMLNTTKPKSDIKDKNVRALTLEEHKLFIKAIENSKYKNIFIIALNTGMRCGEILALKPQDIDFKNNCIHVHRTLSRNENDKPVVENRTKTYAGTRDIPINKQLLDIFKKVISEMYSNDNNIIFTNEGNLIAVSTLNSAFHRICEKIGIKTKENNSRMSLHSLRHTFATRCIESGMPAHVLQKILGHTDVAITINTYTDIFDKYKLEEFNKFYSYTSSNNLL